MNEKRAKRVITIVLPWLTLRRIKMLTETPYFVTDEPKDQWDRGYEKFADEVRLNMGLGDWEPKQL